MATGGAALTAIGLSIDFNSGQLVGSPSTATVIASVVVRGTDALGNTFDYNPFGVEVVELDVMTISTFDPAVRATVGVPYAFNGPNVVGLTGRPIIEYVNALPGGLTAPTDETSTDGPTSGTQIDTDGIISGVPAESGTFVLQVKHHLSRNNRASYGYKRASWNFIRTTA